MKKRNEFFIIIFYNVPMAACRWTLEKCTAYRRTQRDFRFGYGVYLCNFDLARLFAHHFNCVIQTPHIIIELLISLQHCF